MFDRVNQQAFGDTACHFSHGQIGLGAAPFFPQPGSCLHPEVLCANLITMAAAAAGNWLAGVIPPVFNAVRTPEFEGFPSLLQAALSPQFTNNDAPEMIGFANLLNEQDATDAFIGGQERSHKLLAQLQAPGQSLEWSGQSPGEPPVTVRFQRTDETTDDGSWVMRTDLYHGHELKSSRSTRVHTVSDDARQPEEFRDDVSRGFRSCLGRMAQGEDPRIAVVCEDGATLSGAMAAAMQQMHREFQRSTHDGPDAASSPQADQRSSRAYQETCRQTLGQGFAKGMEPFLHLGARRPADRFADARQPNRPPEAMFRSPCVSTQRARPPIVELDNESDEDAGYESDLSDETMSIAGSDIAGSDVGGRTRSLGERLFIEELSSEVHEAPTESPPAPVTPKAPPRSKRDAQADARRIAEQAAPAEPTRPSEPAVAATPEAAIPAASTIRKSASMPDLNRPEELPRPPSRVGSDPSLDRPTPRPRGSLRNANSRPQLQQQIDNVQRLKREHDAAMREKQAVQQANVAKIQRALSDSALATPSAATEKMLEQARKAATEEALAAAARMRQPNPLLDSPIPDDLGLPEPIPSTVNRAAPDSRPALTAQIASSEQDLMEWRDLWEDLDSVEQEMSSSVPAGMRRVQSEPSVALLNSESPALAVRLGKEMQRGVFGLVGRGEPEGRLARAARKVSLGLGLSKASDPLGDLADGLIPLIAKLRQEFDRNEGGRAANGAERQAFVERRLRSHADDAVQELSDDEAAGLFEVFGSQSSLAIEAAEQRAKAGRALLNERQAGGGVVTPESASRAVRLAGLDAAMNALTAAVDADAHKRATR